MFSTKLFCASKEEREKFINDINNLIKDQGFDPLPPPQEIPQNSSEGFYKLIASLAVKDYLKDKDLILMNLLTQKSFITIAIMFMNQIFDFVYFIL